MNFLQLCQKAQQYSGIQGMINSITTVPAGTQDATIVEMVKSAWIDIQNYRKDFKFMRTEVDLTLLSTKTKYSVVDILGATLKVSNWQTNRIIYDFSPLQYIPYNIWILTETPEAGEPAAFTVVPETNDLIFTPVDASYSVTLHYYGGFKALTTNTDVPELPSRFHLLIVYKTIMDLSTSSGDLLNYQMYAHKYDVMMGQLMRSEVPAKRVRFIPIA